MLKYSLLGAAGLATGGLGLTACSREPDATATLVALFNPNRVIAAGMPQRLPFGLVDNGIRLTGDGEPVGFRVLHGDDVIDEGETIGRVVAHEHPEGTEDHQHSGLLRYYAVRTTLPETGIFDVELRINNTVTSAPVQAFDRSEISVLLPGDPFPSMDTPTFDDHRGVDPLCTEFGEPCPFHETTVAEILARRSPMAVLVATPAFCVTAYCGPVLTTLREAHPGASHIEMVHLEPYANPREVGGDLSSDRLRLAPSLGALGLDFEPALFLVNSAGVLVDRIDNVFDLSELEPALAALR